MFPSTPAIVVESSVGAPGTVSGTPTTMLDGAPLPTAFTACSRTEYDVPLTRPPMTSGLEVAAGERGVQVAPPSREYS